jgi:hypothetical protein
MTAAIWSGCGGKLSSGAPSGMGLISNPAWMEHRPIENAKRTACGKVAVARVSQNVCSWKLTGKGKQHQMHFEHLPGGAKSCSSSCCQVNGAIVVSMMIGCQTL